MKAGCLGLNDASASFITNSNTWYFVGIISISTGWESTLAIKTDGTLWAWGEE